MTKSVIQSTEETTGKSAIESIAEQYQVLIQDYSDTSSKISSTVMFSEAQLESVDEELSAFVVQSKELANYSSAKETTLRVISKVPLIGGRAKKSIDEIRKERLNDKSITEVVDALFDGIGSQADSLSNTINRLHELQASTKNIIIPTKALDEQTDVLIAEGKLTGGDRINSMKVSIQLKAMVDSAESRVQDLNVIIKVAEGVLLNIVKTMPVSKSELLNQIIMDAGVSQINAISDSVKSVYSLKERISTDMYEKTHISVVNLLESTSISPKEAEKIKKNNARRMKLTSEIHTAVAQYEDSMTENYKLVSEAMTESSNQRALLSAPMTTDQQDHLIESSQTH